MANVMFYASLVFFCIAVYNIIGYISDTNKYVILKEVNRDKSIVDRVMEHTFKMKYKIEQEKDTAQIYSILAMTTLYLS